MMKRSLTTLFALAMLELTATAQESQTEYNFLRIPVSAHAAAVGGDNVSIIEDDASLVFSNPALLSSVSDKTLNLNFMTYMAGSVTGSASFNRVVNDKASWGIQGQYINYGSMKETDENNVETGTFSAQEIALSGTFSYLLAKNLVGGITARWVSSYMGGYSSMAAGIDLGLNYYDPDTEWSVSAVAKNLGGQFKAYADEYGKMPLDLQVGASKRFATLPFRLSVTLVGLNNWDYGLLQHLVCGAEIMLGDQFYIAGGYNFRRAKDMKISNGGTTESDESSHGAGLSFGAGMQLERFKLHVAYAKYHVSSSSILVNLSYCL